MSRFGLSTDAEQLDHAVCEATIPLRMRMRCVQPQLLLFPLCMTPVIEQRFAKRQLQVCIWRPDDCLWSGTMCAGLSADTPHAHACPQLPSPPQLAAVPVNREVGRCPGYGTAMVTSHRARQGAVATRLTAGVVAERSEHAIAGQGGLATVLGRQALDGQMTYNATPGQAAPRPSPAFPRLVALGT
jgi:hypothetical protein